MEKQTKSKGKRAESATWKSCLFVGMEWEKCDVNGNPIYNALFLAHGETLQKFRLWGYSITRNILDEMKPLTPCTLTFHWYRNYKWLGVIQTEGGKNDN